MCKNADGRRNPICTRLREEMICEQYCEGCGRFGYSERRKQSFLSMCACVCIHFVKYKYNYWLFAFLLNYLITSEHWQGMQTPGWREAVCGGTNGKPAALSSYFLPISNCPLCLLDMVECVVTGGVNLMTYFIGARMVWTFSLKKMICEQNCKTII